MRWLTLFLALLIAALQYPLWLGKGSWLRVWEVDQKIAAQKQVNQGMKARNASLEAEVRDLKQGYDAIEERARSELGMVKQDEVFFQVLENGKVVRPPAALPAKPQQRGPGREAAPRPAGTPVAGEPIR